jgi:glycosyltransferase involved in cell wall biosynthesis
MIGILAQYGRNETTIAAIRLADLALAQGHDVRFVSTSIHEKNVHPFWDERVRSGKGSGIYKGMFGCTHVVHFDTQPHLLNQVKLVAENAVQIVVPNWHSIADATCEHLKQYNVVVCPSAACHKPLQNYFAVEGMKGNTVPVLTWCRWDSGLPPLHRDGSVEDAKLKACFYCNSATDQSSVIWDTINDLLCALETLEITVLHIASWSRGSRLTIRDLCKKHKRLTVKRAGNVNQQVKIFREHDWVVVPSIKADFGIVVMRALSCGAPVISYDVPPISEMITEGHRGYLIPCEVQSTKYAKYAKPDFKSFYQTCEKAFSDRRIVMRLQQQDWRMLSHQQTFNDVWLVLWGLTDDA